jgi:hypothetical protein
VKYPTGAASSIRVAGRAATALLALACTAPPAPGGGGEAPPEAPTEGSTTSSSPTVPSHTIPAPTDPLPRIGEALLDACPARTSTGDTGTAATTDTGATSPDGDLARITIPAAVCNDGTPTIAYVRLGAPGVTDWLVYLEGNQTCATQATCADRWCEGAPRMTSSGAGERRSHGGIFLSSPSNTLSSWNIVYAESCSSDLWVGTREGHVMQGDPEWPAFTMDFDGYAAVGALLDALDAGVAADDGTVTMPPLGSAGRILLGGSSAGAQGLFYHLDRVAARYPGIEVLGLFDEGIYPDPTTFEVDLVAGYEAAIAAHWDADHVATYGALVDDSCAATWAATEPWRCADMWEVPRNQVATPYFLHYDLLNPTGLDDFVALGATPTTYAQANARSLSALSVLPGLGIHAPSCGQHVNLLSSLWFETATVADPDGDPPLTFHDALVAWLRGTPTQVIGDPDGSTSTCSR